MSWIIGYVGQSLSRQRRDKLAATAVGAFVERAGRTYYLAAGGIPETCLGGDLSEADGHWCVVGTGIRLDSGECRLLSANDWRRRLVSEHPRLDRLGGGFVAVRRRAHRFEAFSDVLGIRNLYWRRVENGFLFSTRTDWLASLEGGLSLDWEALGSHWLGYNQLAHRSLVDGVERLGAGGHLVLSDSSARVDSHPFFPRSSSYHDAPSALLAAQLAATDDRMVSLGLSGGMDSRTLLALRPRGDRFGVHVFGPKSREDVTVALSIAEEERLIFSHFHVPPVDKADLLRVVSDHVVEAQAVSPASASLSLRYYPELRSQHKLVVDGGFGEIMRRQFMNRLLRRGTYAIRERDAKAAFEFVRFQRASVFSDAAQETLERGAIEDMATLLEEAAGWLELGLENVVDLMNVRTRLPNFFGYEQARLDGLVQNYMPYAHPRVLDSVFHISARRRRGGRVSRRIIAANGPRLRRYPLVKNDVSYPYGLPRIASAVLVRLAKRFGNRKQPLDRMLVLAQLREFIMDRIRSSEVRNHEAYDRRALDQLAEGYYRNGSDGAQLDWWLAFDLWRSAIEQAKPA